MKADELAQRAKRVVARQGGQDSNLSPSRPAAPRSRPVRVTTDLAPRTYRSLTAFTDLVAERLGRARVPHSEVVRALLAELEMNADLQRAVEERLSQ